MDMPQVIVGKENEIDFISQPRSLLACAPKYEDIFEGVQDVRSMQEEAKKVSNKLTSVGGGKMAMRVACMPHDLLAAIYEVNPYFLKDKREFYSWLNRHPYYRVGGVLGF